jgi:hypothetical protein
MQEIIEFADNNGLDVLLRTVILEARTIYTEDDLISFYSRFGFSTTVPFNTTFNMFRRHID